VGEALAQPLPVGLLEVLEEDVSVVDMVDTTRLVRRGRQLVEMSHPPLDLQEKKTKLYIFDTVLSSMLE